MAESSHQEVADFAPFGGGGVGGVDLLLLIPELAVTKKIRLGTGVNILSQVNPLYMAKQAASLDFVSNGRFMLGVGIGWLKEEF